VLTVNTAFSLCFIAIVLMCVCHILKDYLLTYLLTVTDNKNNNSSISCSAEFILLFTFSLIIISTAGQTIGQKSKRFVSVSYE